MLVSFGKMQVEGYIVALKETTDCPPEKLKSIISVIDPYPVINPELMRLCRFMVDKYHLRMVDVLRLCLPSQMRTGSVKELVIKRAYVSERYKNEDPTLFIKKNATGNHMYSSGLKQFRCFVLDTIDSIDEKEIQIVESIKANKTIEETEKEALVKSRVGQGDFRKSLIEKYDGKCVVTGIDLTKLLIASHIKPWRISDNKERLSSENGLLLSANLDKLFDSGLITFMNDGTLVPSSFINRQNRIKLGLNDDIKVDLKASSDMFINLEYHRDVIFVS